MNQDKDRGGKIVTISFLWGAMVFTYMIRTALGVVGPVLMKELDISFSDFGWIQSGWNWSYTGGLLFIGMVVDRFGPWIVMGLGGLGWSLSTIALPLASTFTSLFLMRLLFGFAQSMLIPANATAISRRFSPVERTRAVATAFSGNQVGPALCAIVAAYILTRLGWHAVFYVIGVASLLWTLSWFLFFPNKQVGREVEPGRAAAGAREQRLSWFRLFSYRATWGIALGQFGYLYAYFFFVNWLPTYFVHDRNLSIMRSGAFSSLSFWAGMIGTLGGGWLCDYLIARGTSLTRARKSIIGLGLVVCTGSLFIAAFAQEIWLAVTFLVLAVGFLRLATGPCNSLPIDLAPRSVVGSLTSIQNLFGNIGGLLVPIVTGYLVDLTGNFFIALLVAAGMALFGAISYVFILGNLETGRIVPRASAAVRVSPSEAL